MTLINNTHQTVRLYLGGRNILHHHGMDYICILTQSVMCYSLFSLFRTTCKRDFAIS
ncbi:hypothetical protein PGIGA_G00177280 [Pangasianodon gigas]|uniref:Uncharacterized protein n=1 Tax=Pangasianodon gigas TaxID=30993 RepID=A0ACC5XVI2_PANGG|nr:hypothetical protein [Pangasianodon gigas]